MARFNRFSFCAAFWAMLSAANAGAAEYTTDVVQPYTLRMQRVALAPITCPRELDCPALEKSLADRLESARHTVIGAAETRDLMTRANVGDLGQIDHTLILAEGLRVEGFVIVKIVEAQVEASVPASSSASSRFRSRPGDKHAALELRMLAQDGSTRAEATGEAHVGGMRNLQSVTVELFEAMLAEISKTDARD